MPATLWGGAQRVPAPAPSPNRLLAIGCQVCYRSIFRGATGAIATWSKPPHHTMAEHSKHQQRIIRNYYNHRETLALQRLGELVTELYLAEGSKQRQRQWKFIVAALEKLNVKKPQIDHLVKQDDAALLAKFLEQLGAAG
jgi:hypothetical protein